MSWVQPAGRSRVGWMVAVGLAILALAALRNAAGSMAWTGVLIVGVAGAVAAYAWTSRIRARARRVLGRYRVEGSRVWVDERAYDLDVPHLARAGPCDDGVLVQLASELATDVLLVPDDGAWGEPTLPPATVSRCLRRLTGGAPGIARHGPTRGRYASFVAALRDALERNREHERSIAARAQVPPASRPPAPTLATPRKLPFVGGGGAGYRGERRDPEDGPAFVADFVGRASEVDDGVFVDDDYLVWVHDGEALVVPRGRAEVEARGRELHVLEWTIPFSRFEVAHVLADDLAEPIEALRRRADDRA